MRTGMYKYKYMSGTIFERFEIPGTAQYCAAKGEKSAVTPHGILH